MHPSDIIARKISETLVYYSSIKLRHVGSLLAGEGHYKVTTHLATFYSVINIYARVLVILNRIMLTVHDTSAFGKNLAKVIETMTVVKHPPKRADEWILGHKRRDRYVAIIPSDRIVLLSLRHP